MRYLGKWKRMPWWSHMHHLKTRNKLIHDEMYQLVITELTKDSSSSRQHGVLKGRVYPGQAQGRAE